MDINIDLDKDTEMDADIDKQTDIDTETDMDKGMRYQILGIRYWALVSRCRILDIDHEILRIRS